MPICDKSSVGFEPHVHANYGDFDIKWIGIQRYICHTRQLLEALIQLRWIYHGDGDGDD